MNTYSLAEHLSRIPDPRQSGGKRHPLGALLNLVALGIVCGLRGLGAIAQYGRSLTAAQRAELGFTHRKTPSKSTLSVVLRAIDATALEMELRSFGRARAGDDPHVALDGKAVRGSADGEVPAVHLLSLYAVRAGVTLAQVPVADKTNEYAAALTLLREVPLAGAVLTGDAMFTNRELCQVVQTGGADYVLPAKENQPTLLRDIRAVFAPESGLSPPAASAFGRRRANRPQYR